MAEMVVRGNRTAEVVDFRKRIPAHVREIIEAHLAIESEDALSAGELGFMARALVLATMPYRDPKADVFVRVNGDFRLRIVAGYEGGVPFGIYPRLLLSWVTTEAVAKQSPVVELGSSLAHFLRDVMDLRSKSGGPRGSATRVAEQMKRTFGALITAQYGGSMQHRPFILRNVLIADEFQLDNRDEKALDNLAPDALWEPQAPTEAGNWRSKVRLTDRFFEECVSNPVPIDLRAYKALRDNPTAMDLYTWLTYRMSYVQRRTRTIPWALLQLQFGSTYTLDPQGTRNFKSRFLNALKLVQVVYPEAKVAVDATGLVLVPSPPHITKLSNRQLPLL